MSTTAGLLNETRDPGLPVITVCTANGANRLDES